jgi:hypothetical protein
VVRHLRSRHAASSRRRKDKTRPTRCRSMRSGARVR